MEYAQIGDRSFAAKRLRTDADYAWLFPDDLQEAVYKALRHAREIIGIVSVLPRSASSAGYVKSSSSIEVDKTERRRNLGHASVTAVLTDWRKGVRELSGQNGPEGQS
jgi:hypothetical protein